MNEKVKAFMKNKNNLIVMVLVGVLLMVIVLPVEDKQDTDSGKNILKEINNTSSLTASETSNQDLGSTEQDYAEQMEQKLEEVLEKMEGAGKVQVIITLRASEERIVEKDEPINRSNTSEEDAEGGSRTINNVDAGESTVYATDGNISTPYVVKTVTPQVEGVLVLAQGAGNGTVNKNIADAVQVLFGIEAHRIKVVKMESGNS